MNNSDTDYYKFINSIKRVTGPRKHKIRNSYGIYDGYKYYRKNKPKEHKYILSESLYFKITRLVNELLILDMLKGDDIVLPCRLGRIEVRKYKVRITFDGKKVKTNLPIDWDRTLKLWYEDKESYKNRTLIKAEEKELFKVYYNRSKADYTNKSFYEFSVNRDLKHRLKQRIKDGEFDAFLL